MDKLIKNIGVGEVRRFLDQVDYLPGQVVSKTMAQNESVSLTLFAFDKDEEISTHTSHGDALILALDGEGKITIDDQVHQVTAGDSILMPAEHPHAVYAPERFKMLLIVVFPKKE